MLRFARAALSLLNIANWVVGLGLTLFLAFAGFGANERLVGSALAIHPELTAANLILAFRLTLLAMPLMIWLVHRILRDLRSIIDSVPSGDAFRLANADRLQRVGWAMLGLCVVDHVWGITITSLLGPLIGWTITVTGWLTSLMLFVLATIWRQGVQMRVELEGTV